MQARIQLKQEVEIANQRHPKYSGSGKLGKSDPPCATSETNYREQVVLKSFFLAPNCQGLAKRAVVWFHTCSS